jgi:hypothetical protein
MEFHSYASRSDFLAGIAPSAMEFHSYASRSDFLAGIAPIAIWP